MSEQLESTPNGECDIELISQETDTEKGSEGKKEAKIISDDKLLYRVDESPPWHICLLFGLQQLMLCIGSLATFPMIMMRVLCADDSPSVAEYRTSLIGTCLFVAGTSTILQTTFGLRLPVLQGTIIAYLISATAVLSSDDWKCPMILDLSANASSDETFNVYHENSSKFICDVATNTTISIHSDSNYYRDNDGIIRNSNEIWLRRMNEIQGAVIFCAAFQLLIGLTGSMGFLLRYIGPLTIAPTMTMITYGAIDIAVNMCGKQWGIAMFVTGLFFVTSICMGRVLVPIPRLLRYKKRWMCATTRQPIFSMFPVIFTISSGWILCYIITEAGGFSDDPSDPSYQARTDTNSDAIANSPWFRIPYPFQFGLPTFSASTILGMMAAVLPGILESIGDYNATAVVCKENPPPKHAVNRGITMEGVGVLLSALFGTGNATTSWSQNIIVIGISRVGSRRVRSSILININHLQIVGMFN
ncbi:solute carrier family 23 member 2-like [Styela clava]